MRWSGWAVAALVVLPGQASAAGYCAGTVEGAYASSTGDVVIKGSWRQDWTRICNLNAELKGVPSQTCWGWFAQVNTAVIERNTALLLYPTLPDDTSCAALATYEHSPAPAYVMLSLPA